MSNENIWADIDGHTSSLCGQRVFYNHNGVKTLAFVIKAGFQRDNAGHIINQLIVFPSGEAPFQTPSYLSSDRVIGSFDIAQPGDLTDSGTVDKPPAPAKEGDGTTGTDLGLPGTRPPSNAPLGLPAPVVAAEPTFDPLDKDKDGFVSNKERKGKT